MIPLFYLMALVASQALAAPANSTQSQNLSFDPTQAASTTSLSSQTTSYSNTLRIVTSTSSLASTLLLHPTNTTSSQFRPSNDPSSTVPVTSLLTLASSTSPSTASATSTSPPTSTIFVTDVVTAFETTTVDPTSPPTSSILVTNAVTASKTTITVDPTPSSTSTVTIPVTATATITTSPIPSWDTVTQWAAPPRMTDLSAFNITNFPTGQRNLHLVARIPSEAISTTTNSLQPNVTTPSSWTTLLQLVYPAHSVNPGSKPTGGAGFYATPLNLGGARNVTLDYSVFFPADFNWVKGGKLPGLFGGHTGCSGGASAQDCFSTRLMWRPHGMGELYLYAPKDKQSKALCEDVQSVCDTTYGFSVGRGAFNFTAGGWTRLSQNVLLNTPGQTDGGFALVVNGRLVIHRTDLFYRKSVARHADDDDQDVAQPAEFLGLFFSTFFGGHGDAYATPKQQYTWFKDFAITRHD